MRVCPQMDKTPSLTLIKRLKNNNNHVSQNGNTTLAEEVDMAHCHVTPIFLSITQPFHSTPETLPAHINHSVLIVISQSQALLTTMMAMMRKIQRSWTSLSFLIIQLHNLTQIGQTTTLQPHHLNPWSKMENPPPNTLVFLMEPLSPNHHPILWLEIYLSKISIPLRLTMEGK